MRRFAEVRSATIENASSRIFARPKRTARRRLQIAIGGCRRQRWADGLPNAVAICRRYDRPLMRSIDRYILRQCFSMMVFVTLALSAAIWLAQSLRLVDLIVNRGVSIALFFYLALLLLPRFLDVVLPIGAFLTVLFVFNRLATESELVAMRGAGLGPLDLARPVLILSGIAFFVLMTLSAYFLPAAAHQFKDLQFGIHNHFVSALIQDGMFTTIADKLTIYVTGRNERGEVKGLLISDDRDPQQPVTILAQRGAFVDSAQGSRIIMVNGSRQTFDRASGKLSVLTFDQYTLDLNILRNTPEVSEVRYRDAEESYLGELFWLPADLNPAIRESFLVERHQRLIIPMSVFSLVMIPLACLLPGEFNRRGQLRRVLLAVGLAFVFQTLELCIKNLPGRYPLVIPLMYFIDLLPLALGFGILAFGRIKLDLRMRRPATNR
jgi:lipopolysaccharide export system permease protein